MRRVVIIGGGISGLSTAWYLWRTGVRSTVVEREPRLGGLMQTEKIDGCTVECGSDSFLTAKPWAAELVRALGLGDQLIGSNEERRGTLIWKKGQLRRLPEGFTMMVPGRPGSLLRSQLLGWGTKLRMARELLRLPRRHDDRSIADFVTDHYGREVLDYIAEPLLAGVYGGDPRDLSAASVIPKMVAWEAKYGSVTRGAMHEVRNTGQPLFTTLRDGLAVLPRELLRQANPEIIHGRVDRVEKGWRVRVNGDWIECEQLVVACRTAEVLPNLFPEVRYSSARVVVLGYRRSDVAHPMNGFGFLVPRVERRQLAACTWVSSKFAHRAPPDKVLLRCFVTGDIVQTRSELREKMGITAEPLFERMWDWPDSMPQYSVGHAANVEYAMAMLNDFPGLFLTGNAYYGVGIPDCVRMASQTAEAVVATASETA